MTEAPTLRSMARQDHHEDLLKITTIDENHFPLVCKRYHAVP